jgi:DNA polymerase III alpha subunit
MISRQNVKEINRECDGSEIVIGGLIENLKIKETKLPTRNGYKKYATFNLVDGGDIASCTLWPEQFSLMCDSLIGSVMVRGKVDCRNKQIQLIVYDVWSIREEITIAKDLIQKTKDRLACLESIEQTGASE